MKNNIMAVAIAIGLVGLVAIGWAGGYTDAHDYGFSLGTEDPYRVQWEVLLTGVMALLGGLMAYRGATQPFRHSLEVEAAAYLSQQAHVEVFISMTDQNTEFGTKFLREYREGTIGPITDVAKLAAKGMGEFPPILATSVNVEIKRKAFTGLYAVAYMGEPRPELLNNVRVNVVAFLDMLRKYTR
tara:strand:- start:1013 stop:1567 length:555 start_codon:yes stop_codon:yes gene_type:complete